MTNDIVTQFNAYDVVWEVYAVPDRSIPDSFAACLARDASKEQALRRACTRLRKLSNICESMIEEEKCRTAA